MTHAVRRIQAYLESCIRLLAPYRQAYAIVLRVGLVYGAEIRPEFSTRGYRSAHRITGLRSIQSSLSVGLRAYVG